MRTFFEALVVAILNLLVWTIAGGSAILFMYAIVVSIVWLFNNIWFVVTCVVLALIATFIMTNAVEIYEKYKEEDK